MPAISKNVALSLGLVTASVSVFSATEKTTQSNRNCCAGPAGTPHDPTPITQVNRCGTCQRDVPYTEIVKAQPVGDGFVLITNDEIAEARADATALKKRADITPHPSPEVEIATVSGDKSYYLVPDLGHETTYAILRHMVRSHPELAFMTQWTPRSNASMFRLMHRSGVLMLSERVRPTGVKAAPVVSADAPEAMLAMGEQVLALPGVVTEFDPATYADKYEEKLAAIIATKQIVAAGGTATPTAPAVPAAQANAMAALQAMLAAAPPATAPAAAAKPARKTKAKASA